MSLLGSYRALDLTEGGCFLCGQILADLGVDVIKIEKPGGSPTRKIGPFYKDIADPQKSLFWFAYNAGKRSITLDVETADGQDIFKKLIKTADFVIESFSPGYMKRLGLGYESLSKINPRIIMTSITFFGQRGPKAKYQSCDLTAWASGGELYVTGDPDRPPNWLSFPQASLHGGLHAAAQTMVAHWYREGTGEGQYVDVSIQEAVILMVECLTPAWDMAKWTITRAAGAYVTPRGLRLNTGFPCKDGFVSLYILGGDVTMLDSCKTLQAWIIEEGMAPDWFKKFNFETDYDSAKLSQETVDQVEGVVKKFLMTKTKQELFDAAMNKRILTAPASTVKDISEDNHLAARDFWVKVKHPELNDVVTYCGPPITPSEPSAFKVRGHAPVIGEHNQEVYEKELGLSKADLVMLKEAQVI